MSLPIYVDAYAGYKANERPRQFTLDEDVFEIESVEDQWRSPTRHSSRLVRLMGNTIGIDSLNRIFTSARRERLQRDNQPIINREARLRFRSRRILANNRCSRRHTIGTICATIPTKVLIVFNTCAMLSSVASSALTAAVPAVRAASFAVIWPAIP